MADFNFNYTKPEPSLKELPQAPRPEHETHRVKESKISNIANISSSYQKEDGTIEPSLFYIISGGEERERNYLCAIEKKKEFPNLKLIFISSERGKGGLTPTMMYNKVEEDIKREAFTYKDIDYQITDIDHIYLLSDVDHYSEELKRIVPKANKYIWIISNPDFEIWLYYSYYNNPEKDLKNIRMMPESERSSALKGQLNKLKAGGVDPRKAFYEIPQAIENSKIFYQEDENGLPILFTTQMHILAEDILKTLGNDFNLWLKEKEKQIKQFLDNSIPRNL